MSILIDQNTRVLVQGITGKEGSFWTQHMADMGTKIVAGVTPGKEGQLCCGAPVYHSVRNAVKEAQGRRGDGVRAAEIRHGRGDGVARLRHPPDRHPRGRIPLHEQAKIRAAALASHAVVIGGNTSGLIAPARP
jgi:succinyl-CoA synthetase alpha subunit